MLAFLGSMRLALALLAVIVAACIVGTLLPAADVYHAWWFLALVAALVASLVACGARQVASLRGARGAAAGRAAASLLLHASLLAILAGAVVRGVAGERGMLQLHRGEPAAAFETDRGIRPLPFVITLQRFAIETHAAASSNPSAMPGDTGTLLVEWPGQGQTAVVSVAVGRLQRVTPPGTAGAETAGGTVRVLHYEPDFVVDPATRAVGSQSDQPRNPAVQVEVLAPGYAATNWLFAKFPLLRMPMTDARADPFRVTFRAAVAPAAGKPAVRNYRSTVEIREDGRTVYTGDIAVNAPLVWRGYGLYQASYNPQDLSFSTLQVVRDPGVPIVFAGFALLLTSLFLVLFVWPSQVST